MSQLPFSSDSGFSTAGNITGNSITAGNITLNSNNITSGTSRVVTDIINSIDLGPGATMDVFGFPFTVSPTRGQLTISGITSTTQANGTWYYQSVNSLSYQLYTDSTYSTLVDASVWTAYTGDGQVAITLQDPPANIVINSNGFTTTFGSTGTLTLPSNTFAVNYANGTPVQLGLSPSVTTIITAATIAPTATTTQYNVIALSEPATVANPTGTPVDGAKLTFRIRDSGLTQPLTWASDYQVIGTTLPTATVDGKTLYVGCIYNDSELTWDVVSVAQQA